MKVYTLTYNTRDTSITLEDRVYSSVLKICDSMETAKEEQEIATKAMISHEHFCPELEWFEISEFVVTTRFKDDKYIY